MKDIKIQDIEAFVKTIEKGVEQFDSAINTLEGYHRRASNYNYPLPIEILKREKANMEEQLKEFKEKTLGELLQGDTNSFKKLISYKEIMDSEIEIRE
ncbi:hypothetical protein [Clostridium tertium]|uniref:Uncharacterized protein n=1 Tax=Clostridium tertium TaxID=1559 RepID=A0A9X3XM07_9CLOT|nr:hypothetical protein [Clostridium tertium]MDC4241021.1 hypothetical protein [Clostridium tertium]